jgi:AraC-like DNA-binding protein
VAELAAAVGTSRAALARRFTELVGEPPMGYLTSWRMALAADLLADPDATVGGVARRVGYNSPFTFSTAFKRAHGLSPREHRQRALRGGADGADGGDGGPASAKMDRGLLLAQRGGAGQGPPADRRSPVRAAQQLG